MEALVGLMGYMALTSVAAERFTEMLKRIFLDKLISSTNGSLSCIKAWLRCLGLGCVS